MVEYIDMEERIYKIKVILPSEEKYSAKYKHAFSILANCKAYDFYCKDKAQLSKWLNQFQKFCAMADFNENYDIIGKLGVGGYGEVKLLQDRLTKTKKAGKFIKVVDDKNPRAEKQRVMVMNEIRMLRKLDHPNIVKMHELYDLGTELVIVMEYVEGDRLLDYLTKMKKLYEKETALLMKQLFLVLNYLMSQDIIHRDIKTENIMLLRDRHGKISLKLIDFGLGTYNRKRDLVKRCGTPGYVAPEILNNEPYDFKVDLFSSGVILFMCLTGKAPFHGETHKEMLERNKNGQVAYQGRSWSTVTPEAKDLIQRLLDPSQANRILLEEAITHTWLEKNLSTEERNHLSEYVLHVAKMGIPEEKKISNVPTTAGQSSKTHIVFENISRKNSGSYSSLTSHILGVGINDQPSRLNSFYKIGPSKEGSSGEGSIDSMNKIKGVDFLNTQPMQKERAKSLKTISMKPERSNSRVRGFGDLTEDHKLYRAITGVIEDETQAPDDNLGSTCGEKYAELSKLNFCFNKVHDLNTVNPMRTSNPHKK